MSTRDLRAKAVAATPGPWACDTSNIHDGTLMRADEPWPKHDALGTVYAHADAEFVAAANPQRVLALLDDLADAEARVADLQAENARLREMVVCFYDPSPCWFDHHGGCQAHGFLDLEAGETCPNEEARALVGDETPGTGDGA